MGDVVDPGVTIDATYEPRDALGASIRSAILTGGAGTLFAAVQNTVAKENVGPLGIFSRFGSTIFLFAGMGGTYTFIRTASANLREKQDPYNDFFGGFAAGTLIGLRKRAMPAVLGNGMALGAVLAAISYSGSVFGAESNAEQQALDKVARKDEIRKRYRRPIQELINEVGEGRGIYGPGYIERRKQRIKDNYGIDVEEPYYKREAAGTTV